MNERVTAQNIAAVQALYGPLLMQTVQGDEFAARTMAWLDRLNEVGADKSSAYEYVLAYNPAAKYHRVELTYGPGGGAGKSVHAFIDSQGKVYKSAGWKAPAKGVRYDMTVAASAAAIVRDADPFGGYLYAGSQSFQLPKAG